MKMIATIFRKELKDSMRDRRTLITMIIIPLLLFPLLMGITSKFMFSHMKEARGKILDIGLETRGNAQSFRQILLDREDVNIIENISEEEAQTLIKEDSLHAFILIAEQFDEQVSQLKTGEMTLYIKATEDTEIEKRRIRGLIETYEETLLTERFAKLKLEESIIETIDLSEINLATTREIFADVIGGVLPILFIMFCFMGAMYPAIDLAAGEKERGTMETLLTSPVSRFDIILGKFGVVVLIGLGSAVISLLGMYIGIRRMPEVPVEFIKVIMQILQVETIVILVTLLLPLTIFFAGILLSLSIFAKSFKEAQSTINPFLFVVIIPAFVGMMPGMSLTLQTAIFPILNVTLAMKDIIAGTISPSLLAVVYISLMVYALLSLLVCTKIFGRESAIFR